MQVEDIKEYSTKIKRTEEGDHRSEKRDPSHFAGNIGRRQCVIRGCSGTW